MAKNNGPQLVPGKKNVINHFSMVDGKLVKTTEVVDLSPAPVPTSLPVWATGHVTLSAAAAIHQREADLSLLAGDGCAEDGF